MKTTPFLALGCAVIIAGSAAAAEGTLAFHADGTNGFAFDTGMIHGRLRAGGQSRGLTPVIHNRSGLRIDRGAGLLGHYRLFTANSRYPDGWSIPSEATLRADGSVEVTWAASADRPFTLAAVYRIVGPSEIEVQTTVQAREKIDTFESFLASYFSPDFTNAAVLIRSAERPDSRRFVRAEERHGTWLVFPRDDQAMAIVRDGRWAIEPNPVNWTRMPAFAAPVALRRAPTAGLTAVLMGESAECFAVLMPHETETHYSLYLSQFGQRLGAGEKRSSRARLVLLDNGSDAEAERSYDRWQPRP